MNGEFKPSIKSGETWVLLGFLVIGGALLLTGRTELYTRWMEDIGPYVGAFVGARIGAKLLAPLVNGRRNPK